MFENDTNADGTVSRRSVLETAGGLVAGSAVFAGLGSRTGAAETEDGLRAEVRELNEEYIAVDVRFPTDTFTEEVEFPDGVFLGLADGFVVHEEEDAVSLPEDTEGLARPVEVRSVETGSETSHRKVLYFRTADSGNVWDRLSEGEEVTTGVGLFARRTIPIRCWDKPNVGGMG